MVPAPKIIPVVEYNNDKYENCEIIQTGNGIILDTEGNTIAAPRFVLRLILQTASSRVEPKVNEDGSQSITVEDDYKNKLILHIGTELLSSEIVALISHRLPPPPPSVPAPAPAPAPAAPSVESLSSGELSNLSPASSEPSD